MRAVDAGGLSSAYSNVASATTPRAAISVVRSTPTGTVNLSTTANDWVHWGLSTSTTVTRKAGVAPSIGAVAIVGAVPATRYTSHPVAFTWTDGAPTTTATTNAAIYVSGVGNGFRLTVPADSIRRRLTLYVGVWRAQGRLVASLSDGSTPDYVDTGLNNAGGATAGRYTIEYQAGTANQTLTVTFTQESGDGNVTLQAATLVDTVEAPDYLVFAAPSTRVVAPGGATTYNVSVTSTGGFVGGVALTVEGLPAGATATFAPSTIVGGSGTSTVTITVPASVAHGESTLSILGASGSLRRSAFVTLRVNAPNLSGGVAVPTGDQVLSTLGPSDWAHWGVTSETSHTHKAAVTPLISFYTVVGGGEATRYTNHPIGFSWTGGTPTASATNSTTGVYVAGVNRGFRITVPADTSTRTLILYVGVFQSQGRLVAQLSDQSAPDYIDTSLLNATTATAGRYTLSYRAASPGQTLTVTFTQMGTTGNVTLQAAALSATASDFILTATPATRTIGPGAQTTYEVSVAPVDGFTGNVALSVSGLPAGATATFAPATVTGGSGSSTLTITTSATTRSVSSAADGDGHERNAHSTRRRSRWWVCTHGTSRKDPRASSTRRWRSSTLVRPPLPTSRSRS